MNPDQYVQQHIQQVEQGLASLVWHRIEDRAYAPASDEGGFSILPPHIELSHYKYTVLKATPKGVWLDLGPCGRRFVLRSSKRQFASPTFEQAKEKFWQRKQRQLQILNAKVQRVKVALDKLEGMKE